MPVSGLQNQSRNWSCDAKTVGMRKCMSDQSSIRSFCSGVPAGVAQSVSEEFCLALPPLSTRCTAAWEGVLWDGADNANVTK